MINENIDEYFSYAVVQLDSNYSYTEMCKVMRLLAFHSDKLTIEVSKAEINRAIKLYESIKGTPLNCDDMRESFPYRVAKNFVDNIMRRVS